MAFDTVHGQVKGEPIPVDEGSGDLALTPDGRFAFASSHYASSVSVIDTQAHRVIGPPIGIDYYPNDVAISPDGRFAYVTSGSPLDAGAITTIDVATRQEVGESILLEHRPVRSLSPPTAGLPS